MTTAKIVCVGSNLESECALLGLLADNVPLTGLVTKPPNSGAGISDYRDLHDIAREAGIPVIDTHDINSPETIHQISGLNPDYIFCMGWSQLFSPELLSIPKHYSVGSHASILPHGRGRAPVPWTILEDLKVSGVSLFQMDAGADTGDLLLQRSFQVQENSYAMDVYMQVAEHLRGAFCDLYQKIVEGTVKPQPQSRTKGGFRAKRTAADGHIDFQTPAVSVDRLVRAVSEPYPGAYSYWKGKHIHVWRSSLDAVPAYSGLPGQVLLKAQGRLLVQAVDSPLWLYELSHAGEVFPVEKIQVGSRFGYRLEDEFHTMRARIQSLEERLKRAGF